MRSLLVLLAGIAIIFSCNTGEDKKATNPDSPIRGEITISADESFKPVVDELVKVYEGNNSGTKINVQYKPEADCIKDLWNDSIRMVISTYQVSEWERAGLADSLNVVVSQLPVARDAIAVIVNPSSPDFMFDMNEIKMILSGRYSKEKIPVFDGVKATSTVRYLVDSVLQGVGLSSTAVAANTSDSVIDYVATHPNAVGFIGVTWVGSKDDAQQMSFLKKIKIARLESNDKPGKYILPVQASLYGKRYPMTRDLTYILKESYRGLGSGFAEFISGEIGQLVFKRAYLMPGRKNFIIRQAELKEE
ncbi:MAG: PstS family phosphate ABC transporter substrate-binding protein [Niabella sp.]